MLQVNHGVRQVVLCKDGDGKIGLRVKAVNKGSTRFGSRLLSLVRVGVFVCLVTKGSPAALGGLRFGDQLLQVDGVNLAGFSSDKVRYYLSTYKASLLHCTMHIVRCTTC